MTPDAAAREEGGKSALLLDLYLLTMAQSYVAEGVHERPATFSLFTRSLPRGWGYLVAAGLDDALTYLESLAFRDEDIAYLGATGLFTEQFLAYLSRLRFTGDVRAMPEGTVFFPHQPVLELTAPIVQAQLVETVVLQEIHFQSLVAGKAARSVDVARGTTLVDFGLRRAHRAGAGMRAARSSFLAGFDATSNVLAGRAYGIPVAGTMAHSYVESFDDELAAFRAYARAYPDRAILLVDTYDTIGGVGRAVEVARELAAQGHRLQGVRLDSGNLAELAGRARALLDEAGFPDVMVFASGSLDERDVARLLGIGAPIGGFGIGSKLVTAADTPFLDMAYKLVDVDGRPVLKLSARKATFPGAKQVWRVAAEDGTFTHDVIGLAGEEPPGRGDALLRPVMTAGRRAPQEPLERARARCAAERARLPVRHRALDAASYPVEMSARLVELRDHAVVDARRRHGLA